MKLNFFVFCVFVFFQINPLTACNFTITPVITNPTCGSNGAIEVLTVPPTASKIEIYIGNSLISQSTGLPSLKTPLALGVGVYKIIVRDLSDNCQDSVLNVILVKGVAIVSITSEITKASCVNSTDGIIVLKDSKPGTTFKWSHSAVVTDSIATGLSPGKYFITITNLPCILKDTIIVPFVDTINPKENITAENCKKKDGTINFIITGGNQPYGFLWSDGSAVVPLAGVAAGVYSVTITDSKGCPPTIRKYEIKNNIGPNGTLDSVYVCAGESTGSLRIKFVNKDTAKYMYKWNHNSTVNSFKADGLTPGSYTVTVTDTGGCESIINGQVKEYKLRLVKITGSNQFYIGSQNHYLEAVPAKGDTFVSYHWYPDSLATEINITKGLIAPKRDTTFIVEAKDEHGCIAKDSLFVRVLNNFFRPIVPNIFTPNGDGTNDVFTLYELNKADTNFANLNTFEMHIFDRWGNEVYNSTDITKGWDGMNGNDGLVPLEERHKRQNMNGVYSYVIVYTNKQDGNLKNVLSGNITLVK